MKTKAFAWFMALGVLLSGVSASAAPPAGQEETPPPYTLAVEGGFARFERGGRTASYAVVEPPVVTLRSDADGDLLVVLLTPEGYRTLSLGKQTTLDVTGSIGTFNLSASLSQAVSVQIGPEAEIEKLNVRSAGPVSVSGTVREATVTGAAALTLHGPSVVGTLTVDNPRAVASAEEGTFLDTVYSTSRRSVPGLPFSGPPPSRNPPPSEDSSDGSSSAPDPGTNNPPPGPTVSSITIKAENVANDRFRVTLSEATGEPLEVSAFQATCPAGTVILGRAETSDNRVYEVFLIPGSRLYNNTTVTVTVTFPDGSKATDSYYCDNFGPVFSGESANWSLGFSGVIFRAASDKSGTLYYLTGDSGSKPKPADLEASGHPVKLSAGTNEWTLDEGIQSGHDTIYYVGKDVYGNVSSFTHEKAIGAPLDPDGPSSNEIVSITQLPNGTVPVECTRVNVKLKEKGSYDEVNNTASFHVIALNAAAKEAPRVHSVTSNEQSFEPTADFNVQFSGVLPDGEYQLELSISQYVMRKVFTIVN